MNLCQVLGPARRIPILFIVLDIHYFSLSSKKKQTYINYFIQ